MLDRISEMFTPYQAPIWQYSDNAFKGFGRPMKPGHIFLGVYDSFKHNKYNELERFDHGSYLSGFFPEKHMITIAASRAGKGAALIIPNLLRWKDNVLTIDIKGENVAACYEAREANGHNVYALDPYRAANIPDRLRASFNPLDLIDPDALTAREDLEIIADGLVIRHNSEHAQWDNGAVQILAGVIAFILEDAPADRRNLRTVYDFMNQSEETLSEDAGAMRQCVKFGRLAATVSNTLAHGINEPRSMARQQFERARECVQWLGSVAIDSIVNASSFDLRDLRRGNASLFLVLPPDYLDAQATFFRLFVRCAFKVMAADGPINRNDPAARRCLFILDEFHTLGRMDVVAKGMGLMPGYGLHIWPFLQDLGQLRALYDQESETFFANADAAIFFGNNDTTTLNYISDRLGVISADDLSLQDYAVNHKPFKKSDKWPWQDEDEARAKHESKYTNENNRFKERSSYVGKKRCPPENVQELIAKRGGSVSAAMIVFNSEGAHLVLPSPYYAPVQTRDDPWIAKRAKERRNKRIQYAIGALAALYFIAQAFPL